MVRDSRDNSHSEKEVRASLFDAEDLVHEYLGADACPVAFVGEEPKLQPVQMDQPQRKVLLLEDDPAQLLLLEQHLQALGLQTCTATTIEEAKLRLQESVYELALFDVQLPDGSGLDLCAMIDDDPNLMGLPIIVLSSLNSSSMVRATRASGGCYFISKPYDPNVLLAIIERALGEAF